MMKKERLPQGSDGYLDKVIREKERIRRRDARMSLLRKFEAVDRMMQDFKLLLPKSADRLSSRRNRE